MNWPIYLAFKQLFPSRRLGTFFTFLSIVGVALGVAVLFIVQSVMNGFQSNIKHNLVATQGEIRVESFGIIKNPEILLSKLKTFEEIAFASPYAIGAVMLLNDNLPAFPIAKGVLPDQEQNVTGINQALNSGTLENLRDDQILIGSGLAQSLKVRANDWIEIYTPLMIEELSQDSIFFPRSVEIAGIFSSENNDQNAIICTLPLMQELYGLETAVHGITLKLKEGTSIEAFSVKLQKTLGKNYKVIDWMNWNSDLLFALRWEKTMMFFVLLFILLVSSFSISSTLITNVVRKTREIGLIKALGGTSWQLAFCFCTQGFFIGVLGTISGMLGGLIALRFRDNILNFFEFILQSTPSSKHFLQFVHLPVEYQTLDIVLICFFAVLVCTIAGIFPALKISKIKAAEALRYEL